MPNTVQPATQVAINFFNFKEKDEEMIARAVCRYSHTPQGLHEQLMQVAYETLEALKGLFNCSDLQNATAVMKKRQQEMIPQLVLMFVPDSTLDRTAQVGMKTLLKLNQYKVAIPAAIVSGVKEGRNVDDLAKLLSGYLFTKIIS